MIDAVSSRKPQRPTKSCYFCGQMGSMTKEHAWPQWLGQGVNVEPTQTTRTLGFERSGPNRYSEALTIVTTKPGSALTTQLREVCRSCNNGWMSQLEQAVRPLLTRLWAPGYPLGMTQFDDEQVRTVSTWATKTAWVRERVQPGATTPTLEMRSSLARDRVPPIHTSVWIAKHEGRSNFGVYVTQLEALHQDDPFDTNVKRSVLICTLTFRGLSIAVRTDDGWGVPQFALDADRWAQFWPGAGGLIWPPPVAASDDDVLAVAARVSSWLQMPDLPFERHPDGIQYVRRN